VVAPKIHMGKTLYLSEETARLVDPIVRAAVTAHLAGFSDFVRRWRRR